MNEPTAILLHGFGQEGRVWRRVSDALPFDVLAPDLRGHGSKAAERPIDNESLVGDLLSIARGLERPLVVGYSMGGRIALRAALTDHTAFGALVLVSCGPGIESAEARAARRSSDEDLARLLEQGLFDQFEERWQASPIWADQPPDIGAESARLRASQSPHALAECLRGFGQGSLAPVWDRLAGLEVPLLVVNGSRDAAYAKIAARITSEVRGSERVEIEGSGHSVLMEAPAELAEALAGFSRRRLPAGR